MDKNRILIADDQSDVLEALPLPAQSGRLRHRSGDSPAAVLNALQMRDFDALIMDLNYTRDTTSVRKASIS